MCNKKQNSFLIYFCWKKSSFKKNGQITKIVKIYLTRKMYAGSGDQELTLFILIDSPMHVDRISMEYHILNSKG